MTPAISLAEFLTRAVDQSQVVDHDVLTPSRLIAVLTARDESRTEILPESSINIGHLIDPLASFLLGARRSEEIKIPELRSIFAGTGSFLRPVSCSHCFGRHPRLKAKHGIPPLALAAII